MPEDLLQRYEAQCTGQTTNICAIFYAMVFSLFEIFYHIKGGGAKAPRSGMVETHKTKSGILYKNFFLRTALRKSL
jgi:hypothetical protein